MCAVDTAHQSTVLLRRKRGDKNLTFKLHFIFFYYLHHFANLHNPLCWCHFHADNTFVYCHGLLELEIYTIYNNKKSNIIKTNDCCSAVHCSVCSHFAGYKCLWCVMMKWVCFAFNVKRRILNPACSALVHIFVSSRHLKYQKHSSYFKLVFCVITFEPV